MADPFLTVARGLGDPARDIVPVAPSDTTDLTEIGTAIYVETGGTLRVITQAGQTRSLQVPDFAVFPLGIRRVMATGTSATGIFIFTH